MRPFSTIVNNVFSAFTWLLCAIALTSELRADACSEGHGLTSANIWNLTGSGDTLCMITNLGINVIAGKDALDEPTKESNWWSYSMGCKNQYNGILILGGGLAVTSFDTDPNVIWSLKLSTAENKAEINNFPFSWWPVDIPVDTLPVRRFIAQNAVWAGATKNFYFACLDGGLVKSDLGKNHTVFIPGDTANVDLSDSTLKNKVDSTRHVIDVDALHDDSLLVATPKRLWLFSISSLLWDSTLITNTLADNNFQFLSFLSVFVNQYDPTYPIYATITIRRNNEEESIFCKYSRTAGTWRRILDQAPKALSFGPNNYCYMLFDEGSLSNIIRLYRDTLGDSGTTQPLRPVIPDNIIHNRTTRSYDIDIPEFINDILFVPRSDSSGYLWIATSEGLFFSRNETPAGSGEDTTSFILIKRAPAIAAGLKKTYARPGILTPAIGSCKFIYNISNTANVTIKIYDYNMDLVTTVIENQRRISGRLGGPLGRSTVESEDSWDGTNARGRPVAPGVYYYKITTDRGERAFGKIVIAR